MKDKFIRFLKDNHAFKEFKSIVFIDTMGIDEVFYQIEYHGIPPETWLEDGEVIFYKTFPQGEELNVKWKTLLCNEITTDTVFILHYENDITRTVSMSTLLSAVDGLHSVFVDGVHHKLIKIEKDAG